MMFAMLFIGCMINSNLYRERKQALTDQDSDGWTPEQGDCDDEDPGVNPGTPERCDGVDEDCDGQIDEGVVDAPSWYPDEDGDGHGSSSAEPTAACEAPEGWVASADDCEDGDASVNPAAEEIWYDGLDQDCDEGSDFDSDGDGVDSDRYGGADCDDAEGSVFPGATESWYDLGVDNDCDGRLDDPASLDLAALGRIEGPMAEAAFGSSILVVSASGALPSSAVLISAPNYDSYAGMVTGWSVDSLATGAADWTLSGEGFLGGALGLAGTDAEPLILISAVTAEEDRGMIFAWSAQSPGEGTGASTFQVVGDLSGIFAGSTLLQSVDVDGDGVSDLVSSAVLDSRAAVNAGTVAVFYAPDSLDGAVSYSDADVIITTGYTGASMGAVAVGDVGGEGVEGLGLSLKGLGSPDPEGALITRLPASGVVDLEELADATLYACTPARSTDLDLDGSPELIALGGEVYQFELPLSGSVLPWEQAIASSSFSDPATNYATAFEDRVPYWSGRRSVTSSSVYDAARGAVAVEVLHHGTSSTYEDGLLFAAGERAGDRFGASLGFLDWDGDGIDDMLIGAPGADGAGSGAGRVYLVPGPR